MDLVSEKQRIGSFQTPLLLKRRPGYSSLKVKIWCIKRMKYPVSILKLKTPLCVFYLR